MTFEPDVVVVTPDLHRLALVVEVKWQIQDLSKLEAQLKHYMSAMSCPLGMIITPNKLWLYKDSFSDYSAESIEKVGVFELQGVNWAPKALAEDPHTRALELEGAAQGWIERLARSELDYLRPELRQAIEEYVIPALRQGEVRAAGPRWRRAGA